MNSEINNSEKLQTIQNITFLGLTVNLILVFLKMISGILGNSSAIIADAIHSLSDLTTDIIVIISTYFTQKPSDKTHPYGHGKFETIASLFIGIFLMLTSIGILQDSVKKLLAFILIKENIGKPTFFPFIIVIFSIIIKELLYQITIRTSKKIQSSALKANALHHRSDVFSSVAVLIGITLTFIPNNSLSIAEPIATIIVGIIILISAYKICTENLNELSEASLPENINKKIMEIIENTNGAIEPHNLKTRKISNTLVIDVHICVNPNLSIVEGHDISSAVELALKNSFGKETITSIHIEPIYL
jgi:cation diffusion facilitator family transporter